MTRGAGEGGRRGWADRAARRAGREPAGRGGHRRLPRRLAVGGDRAGRGWSACCPPRAWSRSRCCAGRSAPGTARGSPRCSSASGWSPRGLLPLLAFTATGRDLRAGRGRRGRARADQPAGAQPVRGGLLRPSQADYLGGYPVADAFSSASRCGWAWPRCCSCCSRCSRPRRWPCRPGWHCAADRAGRAVSSGCRCWRWPC